MLCSFCGKDVKAAGHIMAQCMALHNNRLSINESQKQTHGDIDPIRLSIKGKQIVESLKRPSFSSLLVNLRRVPMGQFLRHAVKEMEQMPFVLTRDGVDFAIIGPYNEVGR